MSNVFCRVCLNSIKQENNGISLFDAIQNDVGFQVANMISKYFDLEISPNDDVSTVMCMECFRRLEDFNNYCIYVEQQQEKLRNGFFPAKNETNKLIAHGDSGNTFLISENVADDYPLAQQDLHLKCELADYEYIEQEPVPNQCQALEATTVGSSSSRKRIIDSDTCENKKLKKNTPSLSPECSMDQTTISEEDETNPNALLYGKFFEIVKRLNDSDFQRKRGGVLVQCCTCRAQLHGSMQVTSNFIRHLRIKHKEQFKQYEEMKAMHSITNIFKPYGSKSIKTTNSNKDFKQCDPHQFKKLTIRFITQNMLPISIVENQSFKELVTFANPKLTLMCRETTRKMIDDLYFSMLDNIGSALASNKHLCITGDVWLTKEKIFFGYTCHWLNESFERKSLALTCRRLCRSQMYENMHDIIMEIHSKYNLSCSNIRAAITGNDANFTKSFKEFGIENVQIFNEYNEDYEYTEEVDLTKLSNSVFETSLPKFSKNPTQNLNLFALLDYSRILKNNPSTFQKHINIMRKCTKLWNCGKKPKTSEQITSILGTELKYPIATSWCSLYESVKAVIAHKEKINSLCTIFGIQEFRNSDFEYLEEYTQIFKPIADALEFLQTSEDMVHGFLLPTLATIRTKYHKMRNSCTFNQFQNAVPLLEEALQIRFYNYFNLKDDVTDAIVASVLCPAVKLKWIKALNPSFSDSKMTEISDLVKKSIFMEDNHTLEVACQQEVKVGQYFDFNLSDESSQHVSPAIASNENEYFTYLADTATDIHMLNRYPSIKQAYIKFNTPISSSAAVERLFAFAAFVNDFECGMLSDNDFEKFQLLRANKAV